MTSVDPSFFWYDTDLKKKKTSIESRYNKDKAFPFKGTFSMTRPNLYCISYMFDIDGLGTLVYNYNGTRSAGNCPHTIHCFHI